MFKLPTAPPPPAAMPRKIRQPISAREWLEDMLRFAGRDADRAQELLAELDGAQASEDLLNEYGEKVGDLDDAQKQVERLATLDVWAERDPTFKDFGELDEETLERFARAYDQLQEQAWALQALCVEAGLLGLNDHTTNPLPLLRMFLPTD